VEIDDFGKIHILRVNPSILKKGSHEAAAQFLSCANHFIDASRTDFPKCLSGLQDLEDLFAFGIDF
jgi:hypothetical protein